MIVSSLCKDLEIIDHGSWFLFPIHCKHIRGPMAKFLAFSAIGVCFAPFLFTFPARRSAITHLTVFPRDHMYMEFFRTRDSPRHTSLAPPTQDPRPRHLPE